MKSRIVKAFIYLLCIFVTVIGQTPAEHVTPESSVPLAASDRPHEMTAADVEAFLDGLIPLQIKHDDIAGATISVVKDGKLLFAKGYGYADVEKQKPVS